jgi:hypothetical protein
MTTSAALLTRRQVAALLGATETEVKARDGDTLHPVKGPDGSWRYPTEDVARLLRGAVACDSEGPPDGATCAAAFELFQAGKKMTDVVVALKQQPSVIRGLRAEYDAMAASLTVAPESLAAIGRLCRTVVRDEAQLLALVTALEEGRKGEYQRGYDAGVVDASDLGEVVDPATGENRSLTPSEIAERDRAASDRWSKEAGASVEDQHDR